MTVGRIVAASAASLAVAGCAVVAVRMSASDVETAEAPPMTASMSTAHRPVVLPMSPAAVAVRSATARTTRASHLAASTSPTAAPVPVTSTSSPRAASPAAAARPAQPTLHTAARTTATPAPAVRPLARPAATVRGQSLPLGYSTGTATKVITVTAHSSHSTVATLQAWTKAAGGGWLKYGAAATAHVGADGLTASPSEFRSATPTGSHTLTQAFGRNADPGTALPYFRTTPADWWISQPGALYNTHQRCSSGCSFTRGDPNEHLYYETPYYNYAVVINTPSGKAAYPHGSAFFLHVTDGTPTAGCVAIAQSKLVSLMRWLTPSAHPRILIGVG